MNLDRMNEEKTAMTTTVVTLAAPARPAHPAPAHPAPARPAHGLAERRPPTGRLVGLEIRKSLSTRSGRLLAAAAALLPAVGLGVALGLGQKVDSAPEVLAPFGVLVALLMLAVGVLSTAGEWTHRTVQTTFLAVPRRHRVLIAKYGGMALLGAAISWAGVGIAVAATVATGAAMTVMGAGIGAAAANTPAALTGTYVVLLVGMNIVRNVKPTWASQVDPLENMGALIGRQGSALGHIAVLAGWLAVATLAGAALTRRRALA
jgi:hypothetical protein